MSDEKTELIMKSLKLLYVEDEETLREQLLESFKRKFINIIVATNGLEGLEAYKNEKPDLIITDIKMPKINGLDMIETIRQLDTDIPIIVTTAFSDLENIRKAIELGVDRFIQKPLSRKELDNALRKSTLAIIKQKEIDDKKRIIDTILGWNPFFSIIFEDDNIAHITSEVVGVLGSNQKDFIIENLKHSEIFKENNVLLKEKFTSNKELFEFISNSETSFFINLENKISKKNEKFEIKLKYYENTKLYLLSFFKMD